MRALTCPPAQLIGANGCSLDRHLAGDFEFGPGAARARIPSMFMFPDSPQLTFECAVSVCADAAECKVGRGQ